MLNYNAPVVNSTTANKPVSASKIPQTPKTENTVTTPEVAPAEVFSNFQNNEIPSFGTIPEFSKAEELNIPVTFIHKNPDGTDHNHYVKKDFTKKETK